MMRGVVNLAERLRMNTAKVCAIRIERNCPWKLFKFSENHPVFQKGEYHGVQPCVPRARVARVEALPLISRLF